MRWATTKPLTLSEESKSSREAGQPASLFCLAVASRVLCKSWERVTGPLFVHTIKDAVKDAFTTAAGGKSAHGADAAAHFDEEPFNDIGLRCHLSVYACTDI